MIRTRALTPADWAAARALYADLTLGPTAFSEADFRAVLDHPGTTIFGAAAPDLVAMCTLHVLPNVTWSGRPYALIENVVTGAAHRGQGFGRAVLGAATDHAWTAGAYKIMLLTGQKRGAAGFYEACGFSTEDKYAMVMRRP